MAARRTSFVKLAIAVMIAEMEMPAPVVVGRRMAREKIALFAEIVLVREYAHRSPKNRPPELRNDFAETVYWDDLKKNVPMKLQLWAVATLRPYIQPDDDLPSQLEDILEEH